MTTPPRKAHKNRSRPRGRPRMKDRPSTILVNLPTSLLNRVDRELKQQAQSPKLPHGARGRLIAHLLRNWLSTQHLRESAPIRTPRQELEFISRIFNSNRRHTDDT